MCVCVCCLFLTWVPQMSSHAPSCLKRSLEVSGAAHGPGLFGLGPLGLVGSSRAVPSCGPLARFHVLKGICVFFGFPWLVLNTTENQPPLCCFFPFAEVNLSLLDIISCFPGGRTSKWKLESFYNASFSRRNPCFLLRNP